MHRALWQNETRAASSPRYQGRSRSSALPGGVPQGWRLCGETPEEFLGGSRYDYLTPDQNSNATSTRVFIQDSGITATVATNRQWWLAMSTTASLYDRCRDNPQAVPILKAVPSSLARTSDEKLSSHDQ
ncbi:hypothetical protein NM688_g5259 [Phlebia brevispora]|uniref:Uncharacterized protein n=1 Tax=Phlebia brevispora TaxID=194682 RepID=A0ACC1SYR1_9APHY|nr:hypothetical protein NM688_g5259 [Phlebia brevispora]